MIDIRSIKSVSFLADESLESYIGYACRAQEGYAAMLKAFRTHRVLEGRPEKSKLDSLGISEAEIRWHEYIEDINL